MYVCRQCQRTFASFPALGGHTSIAHPRNAPEMSVGLSPGAVLQTPDGTSAGVIPEPPSDLGHAHEPPPAERTEADALAQGAAAMGVAAFPLLASIPPDVVLLLLLLALLVLVLWLLWRERQDYQERMNTPAFR